MSSPLAPGVFSLKKSIWEEIKSRLHPSEEEEVKKVIGIDIVERNQLLFVELATLTDILEEFQQQNDSIRIATRNRPILPEPPGRALLKSQITLIVKSIQESNNKEIIPLKSKDQTTLDFVLNEKEVNSSMEILCMCDHLNKNTPRIDHSNSDRHLFLRPDSRHGNRPHTAQSSSCSEERPETASSVISCPEMIEGMQNSLNAFEIDTIKRALKTAFLEEEKQLLEDIEFVQSCLDSENDMIMEDKRMLKTVASQPSMTELRELGETLKEMWLQQEKNKIIDEKMKIIDENNNIVLRSPHGQRHNRKQRLPSVELDFPKSMKYSPKPPPKFQESNVCPTTSSCCQQEDDDGDENDENDEIDYIESDTSKNTEKRCSRRVSNIRNLIQDVRDEEFLV